MPLTPGALLGPYEIVAPLGAGGMGEVYRARDPRLGREVAVKVLPGPLSDDRERLARFQQEARAAGSLQHPGICTVFDVGTHDGAPFVVMELMEGETLRERLERGPLPWGKAVELTAGVARALAAAHEKGIVHRDLKPENLFLTRDGRIKVLDFGLAKLLQPEGLAISGADTRAPALTESGALIGSAGYMAPEQVQGRPSDARTDLFALGTVLYEMLTGARAFKGASFVETGYAILNLQPRVESSDGREIPAAVRRLVSRCMEKQPEQRFHSAADLAFHLEAIAVGEDSGATPPSAGAAPMRPARVPVVVAAAAALLVGLGAGVWFAHGREAQRTVRFRLPPPAGGTFRFLLEESTPFAISPDASAIAFVALDSSGTRRVWLRSMDREQPVSLAGSDGAVSVFWAPDGRSIGITARDWVRRYDLAASHAVEVCRAPGAVHYSGTWGRDGTILFAGRQEGIIYAVPASGGTPRRLMTPNEAIGRVKCAWPEFVPGTRRFVYVLRTLGHGDSLMIGDLDGGMRPVAPITSRAQFADDHTLLYVREGTLVAQAFDASRGRLSGSPSPVASDIGYFATSAGALFNVSPGGAIAYHRTGDLGRLAWFDASGVELARVGESTDYLEGLDLSADGRQLLCTWRRPETGNWNVWVVDPVLGSRSRSTTAADAMEAYAHWLPGGRGVVFSSNSGGGLPALYRRDLTTGETSPVLPATGFQVSQDVSADGRALLYLERRPPAPAHLWVLPLPEGTPRRLTMGTTNEVAGRFSPDGRCIAVIADEGSGYELSLLSYPQAGAKVRVSADGAVNPRWSRDGTRIYWLTPDGRMMWAAVRTGPVPQVGRPHLLFHVGPRVWKDFLVMPDGRFLAMVPEVVRAEQPLDIVLGWKPGR